MEKKLISALLTNNDNMKYCYGKVTPEMFTNPICQDIYRDFLGNYILGIETNVIDIQQTLAEAIYTKEETTAFIKDLLAEPVLSESEKESVVKAIVDSHKAREMKNLCDHLSFQPGDIHDTLLELYKRSEQMLNDDEVEEDTMSSMAEEFEGYWGKEHDTGLKTGLYELDEILIGLIGGDVTILAARPAVGKSALATQIVEYVAKKGYRVAYFNEEMTKRQIMERSVSRNSKINLTRLRKAISFMDEEQKAYTEAFAELKKRDNLHIFTGSHTAQQIKEICRHRHFDLVVIDYLQLLRSDTRHSNRAEEVSEISRVIKSLSMTENVPVIALSQLNRLKQSTDEPTMSELRESGSIEQDASNILLMWNLDNDGRYKGLKVEKNRQGELGTVPLEFKGEKMSFDTINNKSIDQIKKECGNVTGKSTNPFG